jgi:hypothetical protein
MYKTTILKRGKGKWRWFTTYLDGKIVASWITEATYADLALKLCGVESETVTRYPSGGRKSVLYTLSIPVISSGEWSKWVHKNA